MDAIDRKLQKWRGEVMDDMVERMARAIRWGWHMARCTDEALSAVPSSYWEDMPEWKREDYRIMARAAIAVMAKEVVRDLQELHTLYTPLLPSAESEGYNV